MDSVDTAYHMVLQRLESGGWPLGTRLPTLAGMAKLFSVSKTSVWHAVGRLKREGRVHTRRGGAIIAGAREAPSLLPDEGHLLWERVKEQLYCEILANTFVDKEQIPLTKLAKREGVTFRTMKKALESLSDDGLLKREGRRYVQERDRTVALRPRIVMISDSQDGQSISLNEPRTVAAFEGFERDVEEMAFDGISELYNPRSARCLVDLKQALEPYGTIQGFIVNVWYPWDDLLFRRWLDLFTYLLSRRVPTIVLDQGGNTPFPESLLLSPRFRVLRIAGERAGESVGRMLLRQGHRHVAFLSTSLDLDWAQARCRGVGRAIGRAVQKKGAVEVFSLDAAGDQHDFELALLNLSEHEAKALYRYRFSDSQAARWAEKIPTIRKWKLAKKLHHSPVSKTIRSVALALIGVNIPNLDKKTFALFQETIMFASGESAQSEYLAPLIERALKESRADAWVCADNKLARTATAYLRTKGKRVPEDIAVVGFDNFRETHEDQVSIYDFNIQGMVKQAILMIMDEKMLRAKPVISEVDGYVIERRTTRR